MYLCTNLCLSIRQLVLYNNLYFLPPLFCVLIYLLALCVWMHQFINVILHTNTYLNLVIVKLHE